MTKMEQLEDIQWHLDELNKRKIAIIKEMQHECEHKGIIYELNQIDNDFDCPKRICADCKLEEQSEVICSYYKFTTLTAGLYDPVVLERNMFNRQRIK